MPPVAASERRLHVHTIAVVATALVIVGIDLVCAVDCVQALAWYARKAANVGPLEFEVIRAIAARDDALSYWAWPAAWFAHLVALGSWGAAFTRSLARIGTVPPAYDETYAGWSWWLPGFNLWWPGGVVMGLARSTADGALRWGPWALVVAWWAIADLAALLRPVAWAAMPLVGEPAGMLEPEVGQWIEAWRLASTALEITGLVLFIGISLMIQAGWAHRAVHAD